MDIEILKKQNDLTISDDGLIFVKPFDQYNYVTYPIEDLGGCLALTPQDYVLLKAGYYRITEDLLGLEINEIQEEYLDIGLQRQTYRDEINQLENE